ncbi:DUF5689 domain-containing protein [Chitinophagaceae bacterium LWZ2-11]
MKNKHLIWLTSLVTVLIASAVIISCNKKFDQPPAFIAPSITATTTIKALKAKHTTGGLELINDSLIITGIVGGDDKSGNLYKQICIQDSTGGIAVKLDASNLYIDYPVGRQVYIKCKGLYLSDYGGLIQLGSVDKSTPNNPAIAAIPYALFDTYLVKGSLGNTVTPKIVTIAQLGDSLQSQLIQIKDSVQFAASDTGSIWADTSAAKKSVSRNLVDCGGNKVVAYTSGYSNFAGIKVPNGKGIITAIYSVYNKTPQLIVRDTSDARLTGLRCSASVISIASLKGMYSGSDIVLGSLAIRGVVISNNTNVSAGNMIIQDGNAGIDLYYGSAANTGKFNVGDSIIADLTGGKLTSYNGLMEVSLAAASLPSGTLATGRTVTPQTVTLAQLNSSYSTYECVLVKIANAKATPTGTFSGTKTLTDATGTLPLYTAAGANFASVTMPATCQNWVGYASKFNTTQFSVRSANDTSSATGCAVAPPPVTDVLEDFETLSKSAYAAGTVTLPSGTWTLSDAVAGNTVGSDLFNGTKSVRVRGTVGSNNGFIQTEFDLTALKTVSIAHAQTNFTETGTGTPSWELDISKDGGTTWTKTGNTVQSTKGVLNTATFTINAGATEKVRIRILNTSGTGSTTNQVRLNIDDVKFSF